MRGPADADRLRRFLRGLAREADDDASVYLTGGATAVLLGWRESTIDADILIVPERDSLYRALPERLRELYDAIEPQFHRYPAVDPPSFRKRLNAALDRRTRPPQD